MGSLLKMSKKTRKASRAAQLARRKVEQRKRKIAADRDRLFALTPGGSRACPLAVSTAAIVESRASKVLCPQCEGTLIIDEHSAEQVAGASLRLVRAHCRLCSAKRLLWFRIDAPMSN